MMTNKSEYRLAEAVLSGIQFRRGEGRRGRNIEAVMDPASLYPIASVRQRYRDNRLVGHYATYQETGSPISPLRVLNIMKANFATLAAQVGLDVR